MKSPKAPESPSTGRPQRKAGDSQTAAPTQPSAKSATPRSKEEPDSGELRIDIEYHTHGDSFHTSFPVERYEQAAYALKRELEKELKSGGVPIEVRLNPGPPSSYRAYYDMPGWYVHARSADCRLRSKWATEAPNLVQYPRLGAFELTVRLPAMVKRDEGSFAGLPRNFQAWSKLKRRKWPKEGFGEWLGKQLLLARSGDLEASEGLSRAVRVNTGEAEDRLSIDNPDRYRRPERNAPMFFSGMNKVEMPPALVVNAAYSRKNGIELPLITRPPAARMPPGLMNQLRKRLKGAAYSAGGTDWAKLFREQDRDNSGNIGWEEFKQMCRRTLKLTEPEPILSALFMSLDGDQSGELEIEELVAYITDPVGRMRHCLKQATEEVDGMDGKPWTDHILSADKEGSGQIDFPTFRAMCKKNLKLEESKEQMQALFDMLDRDASKEISLDDLIDFIKQEAEVPENSGPAKQEPSRPSSKSRSAAGKKQTPAAEQPVTPPKKSAAVVSRVRARLKGAAYALGGKDWQKLFSDQDSDGSGKMDWSHFEAFCRDTLKLADDANNLQEAFDAVDEAGVGTVPIQELVDFVAGAAVSVEACMEVLGKAEWATQQHYEQQCP